MSSFLQPRGRQSRDLCVRSRRRSLGAPPRGPPPPASQGSAAFHSFQLATRGGLGAPGGRPRASTVAETRRSPRQELVCGRSHAHSTARPARRASSRRCAGAVPRNVPRLPGDLAARPAPEPLRVPPRGGPGRAAPGRVVSRAEPPDPSDPVARGTPASSPRSVLAPLWERRAPSGALTPTAEPMGGTARGPGRKDAGPPGAAVPRQQRR